MVGALALWVASSLLRSFIDPRGWALISVAWVCAGWIVACALIVLAAALWWLSSEPLPAVERPV